MKINTGISPNILRNKENNISEKDSKAISFSKLKTIDTRNVIPIKPPKLRLASQAILETFKTLFEDSASTTITLSIFLLPFISIGLFKGSNYYNNTDKEVNKMIKLCDTPTNRLCEKVTKITSAVEVYDGENIIKTFEDIKSTDENRMETKGTNGDGNTKSTIECQFTGDTTKFKLDTYNINCDITVTSKTENITISNITREQPNQFQLTINNEPYKAKVELDKISISNENGKKINIILSKTKNIPAFLMKIGGWITGILAALGGLLLAGGSIYGTIEEYQELKKEFKEKHS